MQCYSVQIIKYLLTKHLKIILSSMREELRWRESRGTCSLGTDSSQSFLNTQETNLRTAKTQVGGAESRSAVNATVGTAGGRSPADGDYKVVHTPKCKIRRCSSPPPQGHAWLTRSRAGADGRRSGQGAWRPPGLQGERGASTCVSFRA